MEIGSALFRSGVYKCGLIVNCECAYAHLAPWEVTSIGDLRHCLAAYTIGEAATATVVQSDPLSAVHFVTKSFGRHHELCMIPLESANVYCNGSEVRRMQPNQFYSHSTQLISLTLRYLLQEYNQNKVVSDTLYERYFSHAASVAAGEFFRVQAGIPADRWYCTHARFGNTVSASIPLGLSCAVSDGSLIRGQRALAIVGSAGISIGFMSFVF